MDTRDKLVSAAAELFYAQGIRATGVDAVVERSGFSKPTLYSYFSSKDELVDAVLEMRARDRQARLEAVAAEHADEPRRALEAVLEFFVEWFGESDYRGCALVNGAVEVPDGSAAGRAVVRRHKAWMASLLADLAAGAELSAPRRLAQGLALLIEGATVMAYLQPGDAAGRHLRASAVSLIAAHDPAASTSRRT